MWEERREKIEWYRQQKEKKEEKSGVDGGEEAEPKRDLK